MGTGECNTLGNPAMDKDTSYQFSLWILIALAKIYFFHMVLIWQKGLCIILIGTNFKQPQSQGLSFIFPLYWDWKMRDPGNEVASLRYLSLILKPFFFYLFQTGLNVEESFQLMMQQIQRIQPALLERTVPKNHGKQPKPEKCVLL